MLPVFLYNTAALHMPRLECPALPLLKHSLQGLHRLLQPSLLGPGVSKHKCVLGTILLSGLQLRVLNRFPCEPQRNEGFHSVSLLSD